MVASVNKPACELSFSRCTCFNRDQNRLLRHLRVKLEESPLAEVTAILDPEDAGSFSLVDLFEAALSTAEEKKVCPCCSFNRAEEPFFS